MACFGPEKQLIILDKMRKLPQKILAMYELGNLIEFILHDLSQETCFNLSKAAYVVDNPDFDCLKGVAGVCCAEWYQPKQSIWEEEQAFSAYMNTAPFNKKVRALDKSSACKKGKQDNEIVIELKGDLGFEKASYYSWPMKHGNRGILIYEKAKDEACDCDYLLDCLCMIGFCPIN